jgi:hypothetical protein
MGSTFPTAATVELEFVTRGTRTILALTQQTDAVADGRPTERGHAPVCRGQPPPRLPRASADIPPVVASLVPRAVAYNCTATYNL